MDYEVFCKRLPHDKQIWWMSISASKILKITENTKHKFRLKFGLDVQGFFDKISRWCFFGQNVKFENLKVCVWVGDAEIGCNGALELKNYVFCVALKFVFTSIKKSREYFFSDEISALLAEKNAKFENRCQLSVLN